jgi:hypothetical protein
MSRIISIMGKEWIQQHESMQFLILAQEREVHLKREVNLHIKSHGL